MILWILSCVLGLITIAFIPLLITTIIKFLFGYARRFPNFADGAAIVITVIVGLILIVESLAFAIIYHHILMGEPV